MKAQTLFKKKKKNWPSGEDDPLTGEWRRYFLFVASVDGFRNAAFASALSGGRDCKSASMMSGTQEQHQFHKTKHTKEQSEG